MSLVIVLGEDRMDLAEVYVVGFHGKVSRETPQKRVPIYETQDGQRIRISDEPWKWSFTTEFKAEVYLPDPNGEFTPVTRTQAVKGNSFSIYSQQDLLSCMSTEKLKDFIEKGVATKLTPFEDAKPYFAWYESRHNPLVWRIRQIAEQGYLAATSDEERRVHARKVFHCGAKLLGIGMLLESEDPFWVDFCHLVQSEFESPCPMGKEELLYFKNENGESDDPSRIVAPFTQEQVVSLNNFQMWGTFHPFTGTNHDGQKVDLKATRRGWVADCNGKPVQKWAHKFMTDWSWHPRKGPAKKTKDIPGTEVKVGDLLCPRDSRSPLLDMLIGSKRVVRIEERPSTSCLESQAGKMDTLFILEDGTDEMLIWPNVTIEVESTP